MKVITGKGFIFRVNNTQENHSNFIKKRSHETYLKCTAVTFEVLQTKLYYGNASTLLVQSTEAKICYFKLCNTQIEKKGIRGSFQNFCKHIIIS